MAMDWKTRLQIHMEAQSLTQTALAARMGVTQGGLGHWLSGRREINLSDFMRLCKAAGANPQIILFGETPNSHLIDKIRSVLDANPAENGNYAAFEKRLGQIPRSKKAIKTIK